MISHVYRGVVVEQRGRAHLVPYLQQRHASELDAHRAIDQHLDHKQETTEQAA